MRIMYAPSFVLAGNTPSFQDFMIGLGHVRANSPPSQNARVVKAVHSAPFWNHAMPTCAFFLLVLCS
jgi:hypothetical protein